MECTIDTLLLITNESQAACCMTLLVLELLGGADDPAEASYDVVAGLFDEGELIPKKLFACRLGTAGVIVWLQQVSD